MQIPLRQSKSKWITIGDVKFKIGYLTLEQDDILKGYLYQTVQGKEDLTPERKREVFKVSIQYYRLFLKYTIKDWEGIVDQDDKKVKCKTFINESDDERGTELDNHQWTGLCKRLSEGDLSNHWAKIFNEIKFDETDKKK